MNEQKARLENASRIAHKIYLDFWEKYRIEYGSEISVHDVFYTLLIFNITTMANAATMFEPLADDGTNTETFRNMANGLAEHLAKIDQLPLIKKIIEKPTQT